MIDNIFGQNWIKKEISKWAINNIKEEISMESLLKDTEDFFTKNGEKE